MTCRPTWFLLLAAPLFVASVALADGGDEPKKKGEPEKPKAGAAAGPEIAWVRSWAEAVEEAMERNVALYVHSHGST